MKIKASNSKKDYLVRKLNGLLYRLENTGDSDFVRSGEAAFINNIGIDYQHQDFVLFDVGANKGDYTEMVLNELSSTKLHAHLFEPQSSCVKQLHQKFNGNQSVTINNFGLSNKSGQVVLYKNEDGSGLASMYQRNLDHLAVHMDIQESIELHTALEYIEKNKIPKINLLKVDVEGHELDVFAGFGTFLHPDNIDYIQFEYGGANLDSHTSLLELHNYLTKAGFVVCKMMRHHLEIRNYDPRLENFMYQNWVAVSPRVMKES